MITDLQTSTEEMIETTEQITEATEPTEQVENQENTEPSQEETTEETIEKTFTQADIDSIIQKRLERERSKFENDPRVALIHKEAQKNNMTVDEYLQAVEKQEQELEKQRMIAEGIPEQFIDTIKWAETEKKRQAEQAKKQEVQNELDEFMQAYPGVDVNTLPNEVYEKVNMGIPLKYAYMEYDMKNIESKIEQETINKINKNGDTSPGSASGQVTHSTSKWTNMSDTEFAKQVELAKQGML